MSSWSRPRRQRTTSYAQASCVLSVSHTRLAGLVRVAPKDASLQTAQPPRFPGGVNGPVRIVECAGLLAALLFTHTQSISRLLYRLLAILFVSHYNRSLPHSRNHSQRMASQHPRRKPNAAEAVCNNICCIRRRQRPTLEPRECGPHLWPQRAGRVHGKTKIIACKKLHTSTTRVGLLCGTSCCERGGASSMHVRVASLRGAIDSHNAATSNAPVPSCGGTRKMGDPTMNRDTTPHQTMTGDLKRCPVSPPEPEEVDVTG